jgi:hypothetical protein
VTCGENGEARGAEAQPARLDPLVQRAQRPVRVERERDDLGLHEPLRAPEGEHERRRLRGDRRERPPQLLAVVSRSIGPIPDDPATVTCGRVLLASLGS